MLTLPHKFQPRTYQIPLLKALDSGNKRAVIVWNRRCLLEGTPIAMADGSFKAIEEIEPNDIVLSYDGGLTPKKVLSVFDNGQKEVVSYNGLWATPDHKVLSNKYWKDISKATHLTNAGELAFGRTNNPKLAEFLGLMLTDGSVTWNQTPKFTTTTPELADRFKYLVSELFPEVLIKEYKKGNGADFVCTLVKRTGRGKHLFRDYFTDSNTMPDVVWELDKESTLAFFAGVIAGDGSISYKKNVTPRGYNCLNGALIIEAGISPALAEQYRLLLLKFGIRAKIKQDPRGRNTRVFSYSLASLVNLKGIKIPFSKKQERFDFVLNNTKVHRGRFWSEKKKVGESMVGRTYDLNVEDNHNYVANGYIVHNSGKDKTCFNLMIKKSLERVGTYFYFLPTSTHAKKVIWNNIDNDGFRMLDHIPKEIVKNTNITELKIELKNGSMIQLIAADEFGKTGVGTNPIGVVFSEFSVTHPDAWKFVAPILAANDGWAVFNFTPRGKNHAWEILQRAKRSGWFWEILTVDDTKVFSPEALEEEKRNNPQDFFEQEYFCKFVDGASQFFRRINENTYDKNLTLSTQGDFQLGIDLAKYQDWTVITPFNLNTFIAYPHERFNQMDWNLQKAKIEACYRRFNEAKIKMDGTGLGDPIFDDLKLRDIRMDEDSCFKFTEQSRSNLLNNLAIVLEQDKIKIPDDDVLLTELQSFRYEMTDRGKIKIKVPEGMHDDCVMSLALSVYGISEPVRPDPMLMYNIQRNRTSPVKYR